MSYLDAYHDREKDIVKVVERVDGKRLFVEYPAEYTFYFPDDKGKYTSIFGDKLSKFTTRSGREFQKEKRMHSGKELFESDFKPVQRCLEKNYLNKEAPTLHTAFFDIEVDWDDIKGFSPTDDPFNKITAISTYLNWCDQLITQVIAPSTVSHENASSICSQFENCLLYTSEADMLKDWLDIIDDADVLSGWNSEGYDIPYMVNRVSRVLSKDDTRRFCLWNKMPKKRTYERYGKDQETYDLVGRVHLDYMQLYIKYTYHEMHSYSLDAIGEYELNERKVAYEGTLDALYNTDFKKFIDYNRQDTMLLDKLDKKLKFIDLANSIAHENTVLLPKVLGAVAVTEQAIINEAHERGFIVFDKLTHDDTRAAGAYVAYPKKGLHKWVGSVDINSLYPSAIQALNMCNETIVGQIRPTETDKYIVDQMADKVDPKTGKSRKGKSFAAAWEGLFGSLEYTAIMERRDDFMVTIDWDKKGMKSLKGDQMLTYLILSDEPSTTMTAKNAHDLIFGSDTPWVLSANGTIFSIVDKGIIPGLLARWYAERKELQAKLKEAKDANDKAQIEYWDKRQLVKKILLNSLYGAILNSHCRFFDKRIGQSTTLSGRTIVKRMTEVVNNLLAGTEDYRGKSVIYNDTDSVDSESIIRVKINGEEKNVTISELFLMGNTYWNESTKEYSNNKNIEILHSDKNTLKYVNYNYVYRHKVSKRKFKIKTANNKEVIVTEDHSVMVLDKNGNLIEKKPSELKKGDKVITVK